MGTATNIPMDDCGLTISVGRDGLWFHFKTNTGRYASLHFDALFERARGGITGPALREWWEDRCEQAENIRAEEDPVAAPAGVVGLCDLLLNRDDLPPAIRETLEGNHRIVTARKVVAKASPSPADGGTE